MGYKPYVPPSFTGFANFEWMTSNSISSSLNPLKHHHRGMTSIIWGPLRNIDVNAARALYRKKKMKSINQIAYCTRASVSFLNSGHTRGIASSSAMLTQV